MRVNCSAEGFDHNWIEVVDAWTRRELLALEGFGIEDGEEFFAMLRTKTEACYIELATGAAIESPDDLDYDQLLDADEAIWTWLGQALWIAVGMRRALGNASARPLFEQNGRMAATES